MTIKMTAAQIASFLAGAGGSGSYAALAGDLGLNIGGYAAGNLFYVLDSTGTYVRKFCSSRSTVGPWLIEISGDYALTSLQSALRPANTELFQVDDLSDR